MRYTIYILLQCLFVVFDAKGQVHFSDHFELKSLRVDFALSGNNTFQSAALEQLREEPVWGGPIKNLIDTFYYGGYYVNVYDKVTEDLLYSRGFNTLFEEWLTTEQAEQEIQSWTNSISIPYPKKPVQLEIAMRDKKDMQFKTLLSLQVDPSSIFIDRSQLLQNRILSLQYNGESSSKVDLVFVGEGYTEQEQEKFRKDVDRFSEYLFSTPPFNQYKNDFNIWAVELISLESGTDISGEGVYRNTALNSGYYTFGVDRYLTTKDMRSIRDAVWNVPCDAICILVNTEKYGGGGMYNFYAIMTADNQLSPSIFVHEFGHSFAGLADEYYTSEVAYSDFYNLSYEPWEPNITTLVEFDKKWKNMLSPTTSIPTPLTDDYKNGVGVFEGAGYVSKDIYRPVDHCMMRDYAPFCPVCSKAIIQMIHFLIDQP